MRFHKMQQFKTDSKQLINIVQQSEQSKNIMRSTFDILGNDSSINYTQLNCLVAWLLLQYTKRLKLKLLFCMWVHECVCMYDLKLFLIRISGRCCAWYDCLHIYSVTIKRRSECLCALPTKDWHCKLNWTWNFNRSHFAHRTLIQSFTHFVNHSQTNTTEMLSTIRSISIWK